MVEVNSQPKAFLVYMHPAHARSQYPSQPLQHVSFFHNTTGPSAANILKEGHCPPSSWADDSWLPTYGFYSRAHPASDLSEDPFKLAMLQGMCKAWGFGGVNQARPVAVFGRAYIRQGHLSLRSGGVLSEHAANFFYDCVHGAGDKRWLIRSHVAQPLGLAVFFPR